MQPGVFIGSSKFIRFSKLILLLMIALASPFMVARTLSTQNPSRSQSDLVAAGGAAPGTSFASQTESGSAPNEPVDQAPATGSWSALSNQPPVRVTNCLLLTDGRVICQQYGSSNWYALTPNNTGSYAAGTWSAIAPMQSGYAPLYYSSAVLPDGRVIVMGGEYECTGGCTSVWQKNGSIYNPVTNTWTAMTAPTGWTTIGDAAALILANGTYVQTDCCSGKAASLNPATLTWTALTGTQSDNYNDEEGWVLLPDGTVLNVDAWGQNKNQTERYSPTTGLWTSAGTTPVALVDNSSHSNGTSISFELGPGILRPDGTVFWIGAVPEPTATGHTAIYSTATNSWSAGPDIPNHDGSNDGPSAVLPNGFVLAQLAPASSTGAFGTPSRFYEFDGSSFVSTGLPTNCASTCGFPSFVGGMLVLPTGQILLSEQSNHVELYTSSGTPNSSWLPSIASVPATVNTLSTYTISGTQFNGLGSGASYGDDLQSATNYPLVRITNRATGHVFYARTHDHSTMAVATGSATVSTQFDVSAATESGLSDIEVVANGLASEKTAITVTNFATVPITVQTNPAGLKISVDGANYTSPHNFNWVSGSTHAIATSSPQGTGTRRVFSNWSDNGAISHSVSPTAATTYTVNFTTQYLLTTDVLPLSGGTIANNPTSVDGYYDAGTQIQLTATANDGFVFSNFSGDLTGSTNPQSLVMSAPLTVTANFNFTNTQGLRFVPVTPCRVVDTRLPNGPFGGPVITGNTSRSFVVPASDCGIPSTALAYALNVTVVPTGPLSYLTIWPTGQPQPFVSTLNSFDGRIKADAAIIGAGAGGAVSVYVTDTSHAILDINGYFTLPVDAPSGLVFYPLTPCRIADTRNPIGSLGGPILASGTARTFPVLSSSCGIPAAAAAYSLNMTVVPVGGLGYLTTWPTGTAQPLVSTLNDPTGTAVANAAITPKGTNGSIDVFVTDQTHLIIDINGYFAPPGSGGLLFYPSAPCRVLDTRLPNGPFGGPALTGQRDFNITAGACGVPASAQAYSFNATVVPFDFLGYLTLWPAGEPNPQVSTLNSWDAAIGSNAAIVPTITGPISAFSSDTTHLILDLNGYFAP